MNHDMPANPWPEQAMKLEYAAIRIKTQHLADYLDKLAPQGEAMENAQNALVEFVRLACLAIDENEK